MIGGPRRARSKNQETLLHEKLPSSIAPLSRELKNGRRGLLSDVAKAITNTGTDISHADMRTMKGGMHGEFVVEVRDLAHLDP